MGEVGRARPTRQIRGVALQWARSAARATLGRSTASPSKLLPDVFAADPDRLARFQREAELPAPLDHPNIAQIYGRRGGVRAPGLELVGGGDAGSALVRAAAAVRTAGAAPPCGAAREAHSASRPKPSMVSSVSRTSSQLVE